MSRSKPSLGRETGIPELNAAVALEASERRLRAVLDSIGEILFEFDEHGTYLNIWTVDESLLARPKKELLGRTFVDVLGIEATRVHLEAIQRVIATGVPETLEYQLEVQSGTQWFLARITPMLALDGSIGSALFLTREITERKRLEEQVAHQAMYDPLTELANRVLFNDRLRHALASASRGRRPVVVMMMDLNGFKGVNDTYGHAIGDQLLIQLGKRLQESVRPGDTVARLGGDEFAVLAQDADLVQAAQIADRIIARLRSPFSLDGRELFAALSIGIAEAGPDCSEPETLLRNADAAMYSAKREGNGRFQIYQPQLHDAVLEQLSLGTNLRRAVERGEFTLHYQPIVLLENRAIIGLEALVRWALEGKGLISPAAFIPIAERTGLIVDIDHWVLRTACERTAKWQRRYPHHQALGISVNVSARTLRDANLVREVSSALRASRLHPMTLTLEVTESAVMKDTEATIAILSEVKALGVRVAIDDFGIGFSSLSYLRQLPVDVVKIDRSFVAGVATGSQEWSLARGIVKLVHGLGLETVAEGVERADQLAHLRALGCKMAQGYYFARPMPVAGVEEFLETAKSRPA